MNFDQAFDRLIGHEGGYVDDPKDPGGETKWGISKRAYPHVDIRNLTREQAKEIYRQDYWLALRADDYEGAIGFQLFDMAVNSGLGAASRTLQRAVGATEDGKIGPVTIGLMHELGTAKVLARFNAERLEHLTFLPTWERFGKGWARRIADNMRYAAEDA